MSKCLSKNLSNRNKHFCFCCLQAKMWIKMTKWTIFMILSQVLVCITEIFWPIFWRNNWRSIIVLVERLRSWSTICLFIQKHRYILFEMRGRGSLYTNDSYLFCEILLWLSLWHLSYLEECTCNSRGTFFVQMMMNST